MIELNFWNCPILMNPSGRVIRLGGTVFTFTSFVQNDLGLNALNGKYRVDIMVSKVDFANGENWKFELPKDNNGRLNFLKVSKKSKSTKFACPHQTCSWSQTNQSFGCADSNGFACTNAADGQSCTSTKCGSGGGDIELEM